MKSALIPSAVSRRHRQDRFRRREVGVDSIYGVAMSSSGSSAASGVVVEIILGIVVSSSRSPMVSRCRCQFGSILVSNDLIGKVQVGGYSEGFFLGKTWRGFPRREVTKGRSWRRRVKKRQY